MASPIRKWDPLCKRLGSEQRQVFSVWRSAAKNCKAGRIKFHKAWNSFDVFFAAVGPRPSEFHTLRRIDAAAGYVPGNLKWMTRAESTLNRVKLENRFQRKDGTFDWDAWRAAGEPAT